MTSVPVLTALRAFTEPCRRASPGTVASRIDLQFGEGQVPACLAEPLIIAATGEHGRQSLGPQTLTENVQFSVREARRLQFDVVE